MNENRNVHSSKFFKHETFLENRNIAKTIAGGTIHHIHLLRILAFVHSSIVLLSWGAIMKFRTQLRKEECGQGERREERE